MSDEGVQSDHQHQERIDPSSDREVEYFSRGNGLTSAQTRALIKHYGNHKLTLEREVKRLKAHNTVPYPLIIGHAP